MVRDTLILYRKIAHLERELENARIAEDSAKYKLDQEIKAHEATRGVLQDLVLDRGGSDSTKVYLERRGEVMTVLRAAPCYCLSSTHRRSCLVGKLLWDLSTQAERQEIIDRSHEWALREMRADRRDTLAERLIFGAWPVSPQPDTLIVNGRDYEQIVQDALRYTGFSDWLPTTRTIAGVPGNPAADGPQTETEPEGE